MLESEVSQLIAWKRNYGFLPADTRKFDAEEKRNATLRWYESIPDALREPQYERNGLGFNEQMFCLIEKLKEKAQSLDESYGPDTAEAFDNFYEAFTSPRTADNPSIYKDMYDEYFAQVKKYLEEILYLLELPSPDASFNETKKNVLKDLRTVAFRSCAQGLPAHLEGLNERLITEENAVVWLANLRHCIIEEMAGVYCMANQVSEPMEIHVLARFREYADQLNLKISGSKAGDPDPFGKEFLKSQKKRRLFERVFHTTYSCQAILDCVAANANNLLIKMDTKSNPDVEGWINVANTPAGIENLRLMIEEASKFLFALELAPKGKTREDMSVSDLLQYSDDFLKVRIVPEIRENLIAFVRERLRLPTSDLTPPTFIAQENWKEEDNEDSSVLKAEMFIVNKFINIAEGFWSLLVSSAEILQSCIPTSRAIKSFIINAFFSIYLFTTNRLFYKSLEVLTKQVIHKSYKCLELLFGSRYFNAFLPKSLTLLLKLAFGSTLASVRQLILSNSKLIFWLKNIELIHWLASFLFHLERLGAILGVLSSNRFILIRLIFKRYTLPILFLMQAAFWSVHLFRWKRGEPFIVNIIQIEDGHLSVRDFIDYLKFMLFNVKSFFSYNFALGRIAVVAGNGFYNQYKTEIEQIYGLEPYLVVGQEDGAHNAPLPPLEDIENTEVPSFSGITNQLGLFFRPIFHAAPPQTNRDIREILLQAEHRQGVLNGELQRLQERLERLERRRQGIL